LRFSRKIEFFAYLGDDFSDQLPHSLREIFCADFEISISEFFDAEENRRSWVKE